MEILKIVAVVATAGALIAFIETMYNLPKVEEYDDTDYPNEEDEG